MNKASTSAGRDSRTLLPDRDSFYGDVQPLVDEAVSQGSSLVLLDIDISGLDFVLRIFGPRERDVLIREVGHRIREAVGEKNTPYHITEDRFAVILTHTIYRQATQQARTLINAFREPFDVAGVSYRLDAHVGISHYPNHADSIGELVRTSVFACHQAREARSDYATFDRDWNEWERHRFRLMVDLKHALENHTGIQLAYQPQVELETGRCVGVEGLCRWDHTELGLIPPGNFLPFVEHTSLMMPLTEATLDQGLDDLAVWRDQGHEGKLAINLSPTLFRQADLLERLFEQFRFSNMSPGSVDFEVTETGIMEQPNRAVNMLTAIRDRGSRIAVDDFGTGRSSLAYLADLPIDIMKVDKYFVQNLNRPWGEAIVGAAATLADKLGLTTVAEGIEEESQYQKCRELGITQGQGFYIGHPMFKHDFHEWLQNKSTPSRSFQPS